MTAEWNLAAAALVVLSLLFGVTIVPALAALTAGPLWAAYYASKAPLEKCHRGPASRLLIGWLAYSGSIVRTVARYRWRIDSRKNAPFDNAVRQWPIIDWKQRSIRMSYWNGVYTTRELILEHLRKVCASLGRPVVTDTGWKDFDLLVEANPWIRIQFRTADEELGGLELKTNVAARLRLSTGALMGLGACVLAAATASLFGPALAATVLCILAGGAIISAIGGLAEGANLAYHTVEQCACDLSLVPLGKPVRSVNTMSLPAAADSDRAAEAAEPAGR
jgi:hypothetical protein